MSGAYDQKEYDDQAGTYHDYSSQLPVGPMEHQLFASALGDATGQTVLDLGGGTGLRARQVLDAGAACVDVVDLSPEMMAVGQKIEQSLGRDKARWFEADVSKPMDHLPLHKTYDIVMANWVFDHAKNIEELEGMWRNIALYLKPGGRFLGVRIANMRSAAVTTTGKYGTIMKDFEEIPGGIKFRYVLLVDPPLEFDAASMEISYLGSTELHTKYGLVDVEMEPYENSEAIRKDPEFWKLFVDDPMMALVKARKPLEA